MTQESSVNAASGGRGEEKWTRLSKTARFDGDRKQRATEPSSTPRTRPARSEP